MPIDPSIAMGVRPLEVPNQLAQYGQLAQIQNAQNQNALAQFQLASAQRGEEQQSNFYREAQRPGFTLDTATAMRYGAPGMAALKAQQDAQKQELERKKLTGEIKKQASDEIDSSLSVFKKAIPGIRTPQQVERYVRAQYRHPVVGKIAGMFMSEDEAVADALTQASTPDGLNTWKLDNIGLTGAQLLDMMKQTTDKTNLGGTVREQTRDWSGAPVGAPVVTSKTPIPSTEAALMSARAQQGQLVISQQRLSQEMATGNLTPETRDFLAQTYIQTGTLPPMGMGKAAARMRQDVLDRAASIATTGGVSAADAAGAVKTNKAELAGATAGQRAIGTQAANISMASTELEKMIPIAESYVTKVNPTDYPVINKVGNFIAKSTGDANQVGLATALNSLVNVYARAISPKGIPTVSDKMHAREIVQQAMSAGQLGEAFKVMRQESAAAKAAGPEVRAGMRGAPTPAAAGVWGKAVAE